MTSDQRVLVPWQLAPGRFTPLQRREAREWLSREFAAVRADIRREREARRERLRLERAALREILRLERVARQQAEKVLSAAFLHLVRSGALLEEASALDALWAFRSLWAPEIRAAKPTVPLV